MCVLGVAIMTVTDTTPSLVPMKVTSYTAYCHACGREGRGVEEGVA